MPAAPGTGAAVAPGGSGRGRPRLDAALVYSGRGARAAGMGILSVLVVIYLDALGLSTPRIGIVLGVGLVGGVAQSVLVMVGGTVLSRRAWFVSLAVLAGVGGAVLVATDNMYILAAGSFFGAYAATGMHVGPIVQLEQAALAEVASDRRRTRAFAYLSAFSAGGRALGALLAGLATLLIALDFDRVDAYRVTLGLYAGLNLLAAAIHAGLSTATEGGEWAGRGLVNPLRTKSRNRILALSGLFGLDSFAGGMVIDTFVSFWLFTKFGVNEGTIGAVLVAAQLVNLMSIWLAPYVAARIGLLNTMVWTQVAANFMLISFAFAPAAPIAIALLLAKDLFNEMDVPTRQSYVMAIVGPEERVVMAGTNNLGRAVFRVPSSTITGALWSGALNVTPWLLAGGLKLTYDLLLYAAFRRVRPPEEQPDR